MVSIGEDRDTVESVDNDKFMLKFVQIDIYIYTYICIMYARGSVIRQPLPPPSPPASSLSSSQLVTWSL